MSRTLSFNQMAGLVLIAGLAIAPATWAQSLSTIQKMLGGSSGAQGDAGGDAASSGLGGATLGSGQGGGSVGSPSVGGVPTIRGGSAPSRLPFAGGPDAQRAGEPAFQPPLEPLSNEFQRFVEQSTGQKLPIFGERYFQSGGSSYAPLADVPVPSDYVIGPGDELQLRAWGSIDVDFRAVVDRNGQISIPRVGTVSVAGIKAADIDAHLRAQVGRVFRNFSLNVTLGQLRSIQVFVVGQARRPGGYTVSSLSTLINVVFASGGPNGNGSLRNVQLKRAGKLVGEIDLYDFILNGNSGTDVRLLPGDVVVFNAAGPRVALVGAIESPAIYEMKKSGETLADVLAYGGGAGASTDLSTAQLERLDRSTPRSPRVVNKVELAGSVSNMSLRDGDILTLFKVQPKFANAVTLRGNVANPLRFPFTPGMRVSDLIPDREALITPDYYQRKNKLVQFIDGRDVSEAKLERDVRNLLDEPNWEYAAIERLNADRVAMELIPFNLAKAVIEKDPANDPVLQSGDVVTIFGRADIKNPVARQNRLVRVQGEVRAPGVYQIGAGETLGDLINRAGGLTPEAYVYGTEFAREETRRQQQVALDDAILRLESKLSSDTATATANLSATDVQAATALRAAQAEANRAQLQRLKSIKSNGRIALELPTTASTLRDLPALSLEDGDRVSIPPKPAFVFAVGAVANNNALLWRSGKKMKDYLDAAGVDVEADLENSFIVRADGTVLHASRRGWWFDGLERVELMPGDTLVVPERGNRETFWTSFTRGLKDWSQILYQFGLSAAAIKTLRN
ncbi:polysaccharide biosynthesis/export family protein [Leptothrix discophora]|uniref:SLBB domain-containing protein n=1 Tax=Leptothrix discophora TaxID=89 RepID=A0ABT9G053_LEPDI|nr:SLBB domain-containing protein [Leptothrix discophora]MDP4299860.1 SLBB domain-containing protein [Leptothrix discophora]